MAAGARKGMRRACKQWVSDGLGEGGLEEAWDEIHRKGGVPNITVYANLPGQPALLLVLVR